MAVNWEYKISTINAEMWTSTGLPDDLNITFDQNGAEGWELVNIASIERATVFPSGSKTTKLVAFFKRRVRT
jgi:hypothetical protein